MQNDITIKNMKSKNFYRLLSDIYREVSQKFSLKEILTILTNITTNIIACERGTVFLNDEKTGELYSFIAQGDLQHEIRLLNNTGLVGWSFSHNEPLIIKNVQSDPRYSTTH